MIIEELCGNMDSDLFIDSYVLDLEYACTS